MKLKTIFLSSLLALSAVGFAQNKPKPAAPAHPAPAHAAVKAAPKRDPKTGRFVKSTAKVTVRDPKTGRFMSEEDYIKKYHQKPPASAIVKPKPAAKQKTTAPKPKPAPKPKSH